MNTQTLDDLSQILAKMTEVMLAFWTVKISATAVGETATDFLPTPGWCLPWSARQGMVSEVGQAHALLHGEGIAVNGDAGLWECRGATREPGDAGRWHTAMPPGKRRAQTQSSNTRSDGKPAGAPRPNTRSTE